MPGAYLKDWKITGIILSVALLVLAFWNVNFGELVGEISKASLPILLVVAALNFVVLQLKAWRWAIIISGTQRIPLRMVTLTTLVGFMANNVLPARAGEFVRVIVLGKKTGVSKTTLLGTLTLDHLVEGIGMIAVLVILPFIMHTPDWMRKGTLVFVLIMAIALVFTVMLARQEKAEWVESLPVSEKWRTFISGMMVKLREGFKTINNFPTTAAIFLISVAVWLAQAIMVHLCLQSIGLNFHLNQALFILMAINLAILIPAAPSSLGTFELSAVLALGYLGVDQTSSLSFALIYHFVQLIPVTLAGIIALPALGLGLREISRGEQIE